MSALTYGPNQPSTMPPGRIEWFPDPPAVIQPGSVLYLEDVARIFQRDARTVERWNLPWSRLGDRTRVILGDVLMNHLKKLAGE